MQEAEILEDNPYSFNPPSNEYEVDKLIGIGSYGLVWSAKHKESGNVVAIKKYFKCFSSSELSVLALREIKIMKHFDHPNLLSFYKILSPPLMSSFTSLYIVIEKLDMDLLKLIKSFDLTANHTKLFMYQIFRGLKCLHSGGVVHRDLKTNNILVNVKTLDVKISDFGMGREDCLNKTLRQQNHHYFRSPEGLFEWDYSFAVDVWSAACIMTHLTDKSPLFRGNEPLELFQHFSKVIGCPPKRISSKIKDEFMRNSLINIGNNKNEENSLSFLYKNQGPHFVNFLEKCFCWDDKLRLTATDALAHPYFGELRDPLDEPVASTPFKMYDSCDFSIDYIRKMLFYESKESYSEKFNK